MNIRSEAYFAVKIGWILILDYIMVQTGGMEEITAREICRTLEGKYVGNKGNTEAIGEIWRNYGKYRGNMRK